MRLLSDGNKLSRLLVRLSNKHDNIAFASAWASSGTNFLEAIDENKSKIKYGAIGTHFYQTHPDVLDMFIGFKNVHFVLQPSGVFHPKMYYFWTKTNWDLVIGSANMTKAAYSVNKELSMYISSSDAVEYIKLGREIKNSIRDMYLSGSIMNIQCAEKYRNMYNIQKTRRNKLSGDYASNKKSKSPIESEIMSMEWDDYFARIADDKIHTMDVRCFMLERSNIEFRRHNFSSMSIEWRRAIAGLSEDFLEHNWGCFGGMSGSGKFQNRINNNDIYLSNALDLINMNGAITYQDYLAYVKEFKKAFEDGRHGVAIASRLLALKRPDYFMCLDSKNMKGLCNELKINQIKPSDYERYWTDLISRILDSVWWNAPEPTVEIEARVWRGRTAMLDAICYDPNA
ncbi:MAG: phospholipase D family protein [Deltaproteobacteria bacterium]|jgi:HKD family nuclease|nr:phospholipase D family protein [Deltaproteobacteria bacterium]